MSNHSKSRFPELPPYTHVPGITPHPISDAAGHMFGTHDTAEALSNDEVLHWGQHLFQHGYYWEAHEAWEQLWIRFGRIGSEADAIKGLIKLAACGVKCLEGNETGALRHAKRAIELLRRTTGREFGAIIDCAAFQNIARNATESPPVLAIPSRGEPQVIL